MVSMKLLSWMCVSLAVLALVDATPDSWIEAIEEDYVGVKEFATKKNVNDDVIVPDSWPTLSTFPLQHAIRKTNNPEVVKLLLSLGADADAADSVGDTPLLRALEVNNKMIIEMLLKEGVSLDVMNNNGQTVLVKALYTGNINVLKDVLAYAKENEIDIVNSVDGNGRTIVHLAANSGNVPAVKMLVKAGVDVETTDDNGETALFQAARNGFSAIVKVLMDEGSETINVADKKGDTPLHEASKRGFSDIVASLMKAGADDEARNNQGESPSDIACREPKKMSVKECVPLLRAAFKTKVLKSKDTCSCPCKSRKSGV